MTATPAWTLHWLEAEGSLGAHRARILSELGAAYAALERAGAPPRLDLLLQRLPGRAIPDLGFSGFTHRSGLVSLTFDPENPFFAESLESGALRRTMLHEAHHALRMKGPGYGFSLGEALTSEGLAGRFVQRLLGSEPEPWERAMPLEILRAAPALFVDLAARDYDHEAWFFGKGGLPRWFGYALGFQMAGCWLEEEGAPDFARLVEVPAAEVIAAAVRGGLVAPPADRAARLP